MADAEECQVLPEIAVVCQNKRGEDLFADKFSPKKDWRQSFVLQGTMRVCRFWFLAIEVSLPVKQGRLV